MTYRSLSHRLAFTLLELLVVIGILGALVALLLPAIQASRESARSLHCQNNLKQIGLATTNFHNVYGALPPARLKERPGDSTYPCGGSEPSWFVRILPMLESNLSYSQWDVYKSFAGHPENIRNQIIPLFVCPNRRNTADAVQIENFKYEEFDDTTLASVPSIYPYESLLCSPFASSSMRGPSSTEFVRLCCPFCGPTSPTDPPNPDPPSEVPISGGNSGPTPTLRIEYKTGSLGDYAGNLGDPTPGFVGLASDFPFGGNGTGVLISSRAKCSSDGDPVDWIDRIQFRDITDGLSHTLLAGERHLREIELGIPPFDGPLFDGSHLPSIASVAGEGFPISSGPSFRAATQYTFGSWHPGVCHFVLVDGSVHALANDTDSTLLGYMANRSDEEQTPNFTVKYSRIY